MHFKYEPKYMFGTILAKLGYKFAKKIVFFMLKHLWGMDFILHRRGPTNINFMKFVYFM